LRPVWVKPTAGRLSRAGLLFTADQVFHAGAPVIPFEGRRTLGAPEYVAELTEDRRLLPSWLLKPNIGICHSPAVPA
jgi:hypothetical protein